MQTHDRALSRATTNPLQLVAAGFNAFGQLSDHHEDDLRAFQPVLTEQGSHEVCVLFVGWSSTVLLLRNRLVGLGHQPFECDISSILAKTLIYGFGDHDGMLGCLDSNGNHYLLRRGGHDGGIELSTSHENSSGAPRGSHTALAGNGKVALVTEDESKPSSVQSCIFQYDTADFGHGGESNQEQPVEQQAFSVPGKVKQLVAGTGTFLLLTYSGEVCSWGDPRYHSLGRSIVAPDGHAPERPGIVDALAGLKIRKIACGGWMSAALSEDSALYIWGAGAPGDGIAGIETTIRPLREADAGEVVLVDLMQPGEEPLDVLDVSIGDNHIGVVDEHRRLWVIGGNQYGQLGLDSHTPFIDDWTLVDSISKVDSVICGPKSTLAFIDDPS